MRKEHSAGGVLAKGIAGQLQVLCITTKNNLLALPKGHIEQGESPEQAAIREIKEEVGLRSASIHGKLGTIERQGTEPNGEPSQKRITYFIMDGADYTYDHEENYVWIEFELAAQCMNHNEERELLIKNKNTIASCVSSYFSNFKPIIDYDGYPWQADV